MAPDAGYSPQGPTNRRPAARLRLAPPSLPSRQDRRVAVEVAPAARAIVPLAPQRQVGAGGVEGSGPRAAEPPIAQTQVPIGGDLEAALGGEAVGAVHRVG